MIDECRPEHFQRSTARRPGGILPEPAAGLQVLSQSVLTGIRANSQSLRARTDDRLWSQICAARLV